MAKTMNPKWLFQHICRVVDEQRPLVEQTDDDAQVEQCFLHTTEQVIEARRVYLSQKLFTEFNGIVQYGLLKGFYLGDKATWRTADDAAKLLGLYEKEVCDVLGPLFETRKTFVDFGAADGYYGVGVVATGLCHRSFCYEINEDSRRNIASIATSSGLSDKVHIHGQATGKFINDLARSSVDLSDTVILCDIEGAEFDFWTSDVLAAARQAHIVIEIHDFLRPDKPDALQALRERAEALFEVTELRTAARDLSDIPILADHWKDNDRWLLCSEGRAKLMAWLYLKPIGGD